MKGRPFPFHIQQNTTPEVLRAVAAACLNGRTSIDELSRELAREVGTVQHIVAFMRQLGLLERSGLVLTDDGTAVERLAERGSLLFAEAMHHLLYTGHVFDAEKRFSWAYARVVDALWESGCRVLDGRTKAQVVGRVVQAAEQAFELPTSQIAFSTKSVQGVVNWLRALDPPAVTSTGSRPLFSRRYFCSPVSFLWAVDFLYRAEGRPHGVHIMLTPERTEQLCRVCVLDPAGLENVLMITKRTSDYDHGGLFDHGTEGGLGRWILLSRPVVVPALPAEEAQ